MKGRGGRLGVTNGQEAMKGQKGQECQDNQKQVMNRPEAMKAL
jgi:hypothetical protein